MEPIKLIQPSAILYPGPDGPPDLTPFTHKFLAQGDSWFSFGSIIPFATGNLLNPIALKDSSCAVNCARPGKELVHMVDARRDPEFINLLIGIQELPWDGLLLSGGGNDLIDAIRTPFKDASGKPVDASLRLLLTAAERGSVSSPAAYVSQAGWATFENYLVAQFHEFVATRDDARSKSQGVPIIVHTYDFITPRDAGAGFGHGPWLYPALLDYAVPSSDWTGLTKYLLQKLSSLMLNLSLPNVHVVQTQGTLVPAALGSQGTSNDWANEIHPNPDGYKKLAKVYSAGIDDVM